MQELDVGGEEEEIVQHFQNILFKVDDSDAVYLGSQTNSSTFVVMDHLTNVEGLQEGLTVQCNAEDVNTNCRMNFGRLKV